MCQPLSGRFSAGFFVLLLLALLASAATLKAEELSAQPISSSLKEPVQNVQPIDSNLSKLWAMLKQELAESQADSQALLNSLQQLQTEASGLQSSLMELTQHYENLASLLTSETAARQELERTMSIWRAAAIISGSLVLGGVTTLLIINLTP